MDPCGPVTDHGNSPMDDLIRSRYSILAGIALVIVGANGTDPLMIVGAVLIILGAHGMVRRQRKGDGDSG